MELLGEDTTEDLIAGQVPPQPAPAFKRRLEDVARIYAEQAHDIERRSVEHTSQLILDFHKFAQTRAQQPIAAPELDLPKLAQDIGQALILLKSPEDFELSMARLYLTGALVALGRADLVARA